MLWDVSFEVNRGELVVLLGSNGAGKTTTLNAISGLLSKEKGTIEFLGKDITKIPGYKVAELCIIHVPEGRRNGRITLEGSGEELLKNQYVKEAYLGI